MKPCKPKNRYPTVSSLIFILAFISPPISTGAEEFKIIVHNNISTEASGPSGRTGVRAYALEVAKEILRASDASFIVKDHPLQRGIDDLKKESNTILLPLRRTAEREQLAQWLGPIYTDRDYLFINAKADQHTNDQSIKSSVCTIRGSAFESWLLRHELKNIIRVNSYSQCIEMIKRDRVEFIAMPESDSFLWAGYPNAQLKKHSLIGYSDIYIGLSLYIPPGQVEEFRNMLNRMKRSGRLAEMRKINITNCPNPDCVLEPEEGI